MPQGEKAREELLSAQRSFNEVPTHFIYSDSMTLQSIDFLNINALYLSSCHQQLGMNTSGTVTFLLAQ
jgi:hypothetical protein